MTMKTEVGVTRVPAKKHQRVPARHVSSEEFPTDHRGSMARPTPWFWTPGLYSCVALLWQLWETNMPSDILCFKLPVLFIICLPSQECQQHSGRDFYLFCSWLHPQGLEQCLAQVSGL